MKTTRKLQIMGAALVAVWGAVVLLPVGVAATTPPVDAKLGETKPAAVNTVPGMAPVSDPGNLYGDTGVGRLDVAVKDDLERVYVPNLRGNDVSVIDPATLKVVDRFKVGRSPQHVVPSWDLRTLWVANNAERGND